MKIFSSFDTRFKQNTLNEKKQRYGDDKVHLLEKSSFFFLHKIVLPIFYSIIFAVIIAFVISHFFLVSSSNATIIGIIIFIVTALSFSLFRRYIDYKMDYCIITPDEIIFTEQTGIFNRGIMTLDTVKVKSISIQKNSIIQSIFNDGSIVFMSDGEDKLWEIIVDYIHDPESNKWIIHEIIIRE